MLFVSKSAMKESSYTCATVTSYLGKVTITGRQVLSTDEPGFARAPVRPAETGITRHSKRRIGMRRPSMRLRLGGALLQPGRKQQEFLGE